MTGSRARLMGLPLGLLAAIAVVGTALAAVILLKVGIAQRRGGLIAVGVLLGAMWLMFLAQTLSAISRQRRGEPDPDAGADPDASSDGSEPDRAQDPSHSSH